MTELKFALRPLRKSRGFAAAVVPCKFAPEGPALSKNNGPPGSASARAPVVSPPGDPAAATRDPNGSSGLKPFGPALCLDPEMTSMHDDLTNSIQ